MRVLAAGLASLALAVLSNYALAQNDQISRLATDKMENFKLDSIAWKDEPLLPRGAKSALVIGDPAKAERVLGWKATTPLEQMVREMVQSDLTAVARESEHRRLDEEHGRKAAR